MVEEKRIERNENAMLKFLYGVTLKDYVPTVELRRRIGDCCDIGGSQTWETDMV